MSHGWEPEVLPLNYTRQIPWRWTHFSPEGRNNIHPLGGLSQRPILRQATTWKSAPFRVGAIVSSPIPTITAEHSLFPRSFTHSSMSPSCEGPRPRYFLINKKASGRPIGLTTFRHCSRIQEDFAFPPVVLCQRAPTKQRNNQPHPFWAKPVSRFGLFKLNDGLDSGSNLLVF